jgi:hypothetical protein
VLLSLDIDGTIERGDPRGPISMKSVADAIELGFIVGSSSDRTLLDQRRLWDEVGVQVAFVSHKHQLLGVSNEFEAGRRVHVGDTLIDERYARMAGFDFWHVADLPETPLIPWLELLRKVETAWE